MAVDLTTKCIAQYKLDQNEASTLVVDSRGSYNAVASRETSNLFNAGGKIGGCFNFAGVDYVLVPGEINPVFKSSFSVNFWLNAPEHTDTATFCGADDGPNSFLFWPEGQQLWVAYETAGTSLYIYADVLEYNTWQMITVTIEQINPTTVEGRLYVNGQLAAAPVTHAMAMSNWTSEIPFGIGAENFIDIFPTLGKIDNYCIFDAVLSIDEIAFLYNGGDGTEALVSPPDTYHIYRGQDGAIDYETPVAAMGLDDDQVIVTEQDLPAGSIWHYVRRRVRACCGLESAPSAVCVVRIGPDGLVLLPGPNPVGDLTAEAMAGGRVRLRWRYSADGQDAAPAVFAIRAGQTRPLADEPVDSVAAMPAGSYRWESDVLTEGVWFFSVQAVGADGGVGPVSPLAAVLVDATGPGSIVNIIAEADE